MIINSIKRPWMKKTYGERKTKDYFYQSHAWKSTRKSFLERSTLVNGVQLRNKYCVECFKTTGCYVPMYVVDHIQRIKDNGHKTDHSNLQSLCAHHHHSKSQSEGTRDRIEKKYPRGRIETS